MFYAQQVGNALRFGDVLQGFAIAAPTVETPGEPNDFRIDVMLPRFCAVLSPCCSIKEQTICLSPLIQVRSTFYDNPYFAEDLTRINLQMEPRQSVSATVWERLDDAEQQRRLQAGFCYAFVNLFVYAEHDLLPRYQVNRPRGRIETGFYMVDFRSACRVSCSRVISPTDSPLHTKRLELSIEARRQLRDKISDYYSRVPREDAAQED